jgi:hypothetical protein
MMKMIITIVGVIVVLAGLGLFKAYYDICGFYGDQVDPTSHYFWYDRSKAKVFYTVSKCSAAGYTQIDLDPHSAKVLGLMVIRDNKAVFFNANKLKSVIDPSSAEMVPGSARFMRDKFNYYYVSKDKIVGSRDALDPVEVVEEFSPLLKTKTGVFDGKE